MITDLFTPAQIHELEKKIRAERNRLSKDDRQHISQCLQQAMSNYSTDSPHVSSLVFISLFLTYIDSMKKYPDEKDISEKVAAFQIPMLPEED